MGRKSIDKGRRSDIERTDPWLIELLPLIQDEQLDKLSINRLSELMGKSKSTIYQYFKTKEDIYDRLVDLRIEMIQNSINLNEINADILDTFESFMITVCQGLEGISSHFLNQLQQSYPEIWSKVDFFMKSILSFFENLYTKGMEQKVFKKYPIPLLLSLDQYFMYQFITNLNQSKVNVDHMIRHYMRLRLDGLIM